MEGIIIRDYLRRRRMRRRLINLQQIRRSLRDTQNPFDIPDQQFCDLYRLTKEMCFDVLEEISTFLKPRSRIHSIPSYLRFLCALRFFATGKIYLRGSYQRSVGQDFFSCVSQTTVSRCVKEVSLALQNIGRNYIKLPENFTRTKQRFFELHGFPGIIGLIDGTHIKIKAPSKEIEHVYYCRIGGHSKNVQIICGPDLEIIGMNARFRGTAHDSYIWRCSQMKVALERRYNNGERHFWLVGDSGYPLQPWQMTPIQDESTDGMKHYNVSHKKTRQTVERTIGVLKATFRCLLHQRILCYSPSTAGHIINSCAILHNMRIKANLPFPSDVIFFNEENAILEESELIASDRILRERERTRNIIVTNYFCG